MLDITALLSASKRTCYNKSNKKRKKSYVSTRPLHLMLLPVVIILFIYNYIPMLGVYIAFVDFDIFLGKDAFFRSEWVGLENYKALIAMGEPIRVFSNTLKIAVLKLVAGIVVPVIVSLLLNEVRKSWIKRSVQTIIYMPHFISWVVMGGIVKDIFSSEGLINQFLSLFGVESISYLQSNAFFVPIVVLTHIWKEFGFQTIVYLAAITNINPTLYESAIVDGATRWQQTKYITLPGMKPIIILTMVLALRGILNAGFDQIFNLYSPAVYETGDIIDTFVYRLGFESSTPQYSISTAIGLFKSVISLILILTSNFMAKKWADYSVF